MIFFTKLHVLTISSRITRIITESYVYVLNWNSLNRRHYYFCLENIQKCGLGWIGVALATLASPRLRQIAQVPENTMEHRCINMIVILCY